MPYFRMADPVYLQYRQVYPDDHLYLESKERIG